MKGVMTARFLSHLNETTLQFLVTGSIGNCLHFSASSDSLAKARNVQIAAKTAAIEACDDGVADFQSSVHIHLNATRGPTVRGVL